MFGALVGVSLLLLLRAAPPRSLGEGSGIMIQAAILAAAAATATLLLPWQRLPRSIQTVLPLVYLLVVFMAREAPGDAGAAYSQLVIAPVVWLAVYGRPRELTAVLVAAAATLFVPLLVPGTAHGDWFHALLLLAISAGVGFAVEAFVGQLRSHTALLYELAVTDALTGTMNRRGWETELSRAIAEGARTGRPVSVALMDLDHFKDFNDRNGHQAGDRLLKEVAAQWTGQLRATDVLARLGGDEFGVILRDCPLQDAYAAVYRMWLGLPYGVSCSAGVSLWDRVEAAERLVARTDAAMYRAKDLGRNRVLTTTLADAAVAEATAAMTDGPVESPPEGCPSGRRGTPGERVGG